MASRAGGTAWADRIESCRLPWWSSWPLRDDLEDRLRVLDAIYIPTRYPDSLPEGAPTDHFGRLQSSDAISHARTLVEAIRLALAGT